MLLCENVSAAFIYICCVLFSCVGSDMQKSRKDQDFGPCGFLNIYNMQRFHASSSYFSAVCGLTEASGFLDAASRRLLSSIWV